MNGFSRGGPLCLALLGIALAGVCSGASAQTLSAASIANDVGSDFKYMANNGAEDAIDIATAPLHLEQAGQLLLSPKFYLVLGGAGALWGGSYTLDQTIRSLLRSMSSSDAALLQNVSYGSVSAAAALLYGYGLYEGDARARQDAVIATPRSLPAASHLSRAM